MKISELAPKARHAFILLVSTLMCGAALALPPGVKDQRKLEQSLNEFQFLQDKDFLDAYGLEKNKAVDKAYRSLRAHLVGTVLEKARVKRECDKKFRDLKGNFGPPSSDNIACLYWQIQKLHHAEQEVLRKERKVAAPIPKPKKYTKIETIEGANKFFVKVQQSADPCVNVEDRVFLMRTFEQFLPAREAWQSISLLYETALHCLKPASPQYELAHLRMGLLSLERGELLRASSMLDLALRAVRPAEEYRTLFWRGFLEALPYTEQGNVNFKPHDNIFWEKLVDKYPLTLHAIVADAAQNKDFFLRVRDRAAPKVAQVVGDEWDLFNYTSFTLGMLASRNEKEGLRRLSMYITNRVAAPSFESSLFIAQSLFRSGQNWAAINTVFSSLRDFGSTQVTIDVLKMLYPTPYREHVLKVGKTVDPALVYALMRQESTFNAKAQSPVGAKGLMQVLDSTAAHIMRKKGLNLFDPATNVNVGSRYLRHLLKRYSDRPPAAIASYNAGPTHINRWRTRYLTPVTLLFSDLIPFTETRNYVSGIVRNMYWYQVFLNWDNSKKTDFAAHRLGEPGLSPFALVPQPSAFGIKPGSISPSSLAFERNSPQDGLLND